MALNLSLLNYVNDMTNLILVNVFFCISARVTSRARYHSANVSRLKTKTKKKAVNHSYATRISCCISLIAN